MGMASILEQYSVVKTTIIFLLITYWRVLGLRLLVLDSPMIEQPPCLTNFCRQRPALMLDILFVATPQVIVTLLAA
jgi:hypothetical protein